MTASGINAFNAIGMQQINPGLNASQGLNVTNAATQTPSLTALQSGNNFQVSASQASVSPEQLVGALSNLISIVGVVLQSLLGQLTNGNGNASTPQITGNVGGTQFASPEAFQQFGSGVMPASSDQDNALAQQNLQSALALLPGSDASAQNLQKMVTTLAGMEPESPQSQALMSQFAQAAGASGVLGRNQQAILNFVAQSQLSRIMAGFVGINQQIAGQPEQAELAQRYQSLSGIRQEMQNRTF